MMHDTMMPPPPPRTPMGNNYKESKLSGSKRSLCSDEGDATPNQEHPHKKQAIGHELSCLPGAGPQSLSNQLKSKPNLNQQICLETSSQKPQSVKVVARVRPLSSKEQGERSKESIKAVAKSSTLIFTDSQKPEMARDFPFDAVFGPNTAQDFMYEKTVGDSIRTNIFCGYNLSIVAYGQTGSGKTFTMGTSCGDCERTGGNDEEIRPPDPGEGIIPRSVYELFKTRQDMEGGEKSVKIEISYLEIYNEECRDLLSTNFTKDAELMIRDRADGSVAVMGLTSIPVTSPRQVGELMESAAKRRATASTAMNAVSSRSHAICTLSVTISPTIIENDLSSDDDVDSIEEDNKPEIAAEEISAKLTLVDLAGSERIKKTGAEGTRMKEGININKGLFVLGQVISALSESSQMADGASHSLHIPYRDSKLTRLLQDSLGGNSRTIMIACVSPADSNVEESLNTLRYAQRARSIKNSAVRNVVTVMSPVEAAALRRENQMLKLQLAQANAKLTNISMNQVVTSSTISVCKPALVMSSNGCENTNAVTEFTEGIDIDKLEIVAKLRTSCVALQSKVEELKEQSRSTYEEALNASLQADRWQLKYEQTCASAKAAGVSLSCQGNHEDQNGIVVSQRQEIDRLKKLLHEVETDAVVARSTAAAVIASNDCELQNIADKFLVSETEEEQSDNEREQERTMIAAEVVAMSSQIEQKESMASKLQQQNVCMGDLQTHFEKAVSLLQEEVDELTLERAGLLDQVSKTTSKSTNLKENTKEKKMRGEISTLNVRIKELNAKTAQHAKALRMQEIAQKKCEKLEIEIREDKKRRASLQRKLKEEALERRTERKDARVKAARLMRDSQKMQSELNKVKEAAAKQAAVLRRKVSDALAKQKKLEEKRKRQFMSSKNRNRQVAPSQSAAMLGDAMKKIELTKWIEQEIDSSSMLWVTKQQIEEQTQLIAEAFDRKEEKLVKIESVCHNDTDSGPELRLIDNEIESRTQLLQQLQRNLTEIYKGPNKQNGKSTSDCLDNGTNNIFSSSYLVDVSKWSSLSRSDLRTIATITFERVLLLKSEVENIRENKERVNNTAISSAVAKEKRRSDSEVLKLKMHHSEAMMTLMESTKGTVESSVRMKVVEATEAGIDPSMRATVDEMLNSYFQGFSKIGDEVKEELRDVRETQVGMRSIVDQVAEDIIAKNELAALSKKKKVTKSKPEPESESEIDESEDDIANDELEDSDSDWEDTPKKRKQLFVKMKEQQKPVKDSEKHSPCKNGSTTNYASLTVVQLKEMLRSKGLPVSGKKIELIARLEQNVVEETNESENSSQSNGCVPVTAQSPPVTESACTDNKSDAWKIPQPAAYINRSVRSPTRSDRSPNRSDRSLTRSGKLPTRSSKSPTRSRQSPTRSGISPPTLHEKRSTAVTKSALEKSIRKKSNATKSFKKFRSYISDYKENAPPSESRVSNKKVTSMETTSTAKKYAGTRKILQPTARFNRCDSEPTPSKNIVQKHLRRLTRSNSITPTKSSPKSTQHESRIAFLSSVKKKRRDSLVLATKTKKRRRKSGVTKRLGMRLAAQEKLSQAEKMIL